MPESKEENEPQPTRVPAGESRLGFFQRFQQALIRWASQQPDIQAAVLVGSYARQAAKEDSDIDVVLLVAAPARYLQDTHWAAQFGLVIRSQVEDYGKVTSLRVWYPEDQEVEFSLATPDWAKRPLDTGTRRVLVDGMQVLFDRNDLFANIQQEIQQ